MNILSKLLIVGVAISVSVLWASCGGSSPGSQNDDGTTVQTPQTAVATPVRVTMFQFRPSTIEVKAGTVVTWMNTDEILHTVTSGVSESRTTLFDGRLDGKGTSFSFQFNDPGIYTYFCDRHQAMRGEVRVN